MNQAVFDSEEAVSRGVVYVALGSMAVLTHHRASKLIEGLTRLR